MSRRDRARAETCERKQRFATWDEATAAAMLVWRENPSPKHVNPCGPYPCLLGGDKHYHYGHREHSSRERRNRNAA